MVCVGSIGLKHACDGVGSVAAGLAALAPCPVAVVIRRPVGRPATPAGRRHCCRCAQRCSAATCPRGGETAGSTPAGDLGIPDRGARRCRRPKSFGASATESCASPGGHRCIPMCKSSPPSSAEVFADIWSSARTRSSCLVADPQAYRDLRRANDAGCSVLTVRCTNL